MQRQRLENRVATAAKARIHSASPDQTLALFMLVTAASMCSRCSDARLRRSKTPSHQHTHTPSHPDTRKPVRITHTCTEARGFKFFTCKVNN